VPKLQMATIFFTVPKIHRPERLWSTSTSTYKQSVQKEEYRTLMV
jgi:hypothetical protein